MPLALKRLIGAWFGEGNTKLTNAKDSEHVRNSVEFVKEDADIIKAKSRILIIGRGQECSIILDNKNISDKHCQIMEKRFDQWYIEDLGSENGTYIGREKALVRLVSGELKIEKGDKIILGEPDSRKVPATYLEVLNA